DFRLVTTGSVSAAVADVTPVNGRQSSLSYPPYSAVSASVFTVTVTGITGEGTLALELVDHGVVHYDTGAPTFHPGTIHDLAGNPLFQPDASLAFQSGAFFPEDFSPFRLAVGDVNHDGRLDLVGTEYWATRDAYATVYLGNGEGSLRFKSRLDVGFEP